MSFDDIYEDMKVFMQSVLTYWSCHTEGALVWIMDQVFAGSPFTELRLGFLAHCNKPLAYLQLTHLTN